MGYVPLEDFPKYSNEMVTYKSKPTKKDMPYELEHVFDIDKGGYVRNKEHCCYYSPRSKCRYCSHRRKCVFKRFEWEKFERNSDDVDLEIDRVRECISDFRRIINAHWNGEIVYHYELEDLYDIRIVDDGQGSVSVEVDVVPNFRGRVNSRIKEFELLLRELNRLKR